MIPSITKQAEQWTQQDAVILRNFLAEHPNIEAHLIARCPKIAVSDIEHTAMNGAQVAGYEQAIGTLRALCADQQQDNLQSPNIDLNEN